MKKHDLLIFGATGFTGRYVVERLIETIKKYDLSELRWAMAARNVDGLRDHIKYLESRCKVDLKNIPVYKTDIENLDSLNQVFKSSSLVLNCVGPYSLFGDPVLKTCIESDAHYMDLSGEPFFLEKMHLKYDDLARQKKICAVSSCGFDSIPSDCGVQYLKQKFPGRLNHTENYLQLWTDGQKFSYATWRALVEGYKYRHQLKAMREQIFAKYKPFKWPVLNKRKLFFRNEFGICVPFPGSDRSVVIRSQMHRYTELSEPPAQCEVYFALPNLWDLVLLVLMNYNLKILSKTDWGTRLLLNYSKYFSLGIFEQNVLPSREDLERNRWRLTLMGRGWPEGCQQLNEHTMTETRAITLNGGDLGYLDTSIIAVQTALQLLDKIRKNQLKHGVLTPAVALDCDDILHRIDREGVRIELITDYKNNVVRGK